MENYKEKVFSQAFISRIAGITPSTLSRHLANTSLMANNIPRGNRKKYNISTVREINKILFTKDFRVREKVQVFYNFKGGTGKTTISFQVSSLLALLGFNILVIDIDPQAHLTSSFNINPDDNFLTMYDVIVNKISIEETIKNVFPGMDIIPSNLSLTKVEAELMHVPNREKVLTRLITPLKKNYDFIIIDTNPTISSFNRNALFLADNVNIVCETQPFSLKGLEMLVDEITVLESSMDTKIKYSIIPNKYESKTATAQEVLGSLRLDYKEAVIQSVVRKCEDMNISAKRKEPICFYCGKNSYALEDIIDLSQEILENSSEKNTQQQPELSRA